LAGIGRNWQELAGIGRNWQELAGIDRDWQGLAGLGRRWRELAGIGRSWQELAGTGSHQRTKLLKTEPEKVARIVVLHDSREFVSCEAALATCNFCFKKHIRNHQKLWQNPSECIPELRFVWNQT
jgi:hypothetical protein